MAKNTANSDTYQVSGWNGNPVSGEVFDKPVQGWKEAKHEAWQAVMDGKVSGASVEVIGGKQDGEVQYSISRDVHGNVKES